MRNITAGQQQALENGFRAAQLKVEIDRGGDDWVDLSNLRGWDFLQQVSYNDNIDAPTSSVDVLVRRRIEKLNLAPFDDLSVLNQDGTILDVGNRIRIWGAVVAMDQKPDPSELVKIFEGRIDEVDWGKDPIKLRCRDKGGDLVDKYIEDQRVYPRDAASVVLLEHLIQDLVDDNNDYLDIISANYSWNSTLTVTTSDTSEVAVGDFIAYFGPPYFRIASIVPNTSITIENPENQRTIPTGSGPGESIKIPAANRVTLYSPSGTSSPWNPYKQAETTSWAIRPYVQKKMHLMEAIRSLADQIGYVVRYIWHNNTNDFQLVLYAPDRAKTTPDFEFDQSFYDEITKLQTRRHAVRNRVKVAYVDTNNTVATVIQEDIPSQTKYGVRTMEICEGSNSQIDTSTEANLLASAALSDLKEPFADKGVRMPFFWAVQTGDLYRFKANGVHSSTDQDLAVVSIKHRITNRGLSSTSLETRGKPSGGFKRWLKIEARLGIGLANDVRSDNAPENLNTEANPGVIVVTYDDPRTMSPPIDDWAFTRCHVSDTTPFTPSAANLKASGRTTRFEIGALVPGTRYYVKLVIVDAFGNESTISQEVNAVAQKVAPYHVDNNQEWGLANLNANFGIYTFGFDDNYNVSPDHWFPDAGWGGVWTTDDDSNYNGYFRRAGTQHKSANASLRYNGEPKPVTSGQFRRFYSEPFPIDQDWLYLLEWEWKHNGYTGNNTAWGPYIRWFDESFSQVGSDAFPQDTIFSYSPTAGSVVIPADTWARDRGWLTPPSTARYAQIRVHIFVPTTFPQTYHPRMWFDRFLFSRALSKLIVDADTGTDRSAPVSTWTKPWFDKFATLDTDQNWQKGYPLVPTEHQYVIARDGEYSVFGCIVFTSMNNGATFAGRIIVNGSQVALGDELYWVAGAAINACVFLEEIFLYAGDVIQIEAWQNGNQPRLIDDSECKFAITQISNGRT